MMGGKGRKGGLFLGLRFLLTGFEGDKEKRIVEEIGENGGQICKQYDASCTHVVVFKLPLNDPLCCAARDDGKALVTDFWITDALETNSLVDISNVLYRPLKEVDGIEGSKKLCICLTGYQGLARRNIMRMVEMIGAIFSKPLIGSQVTHLVCYKFEGEKYELAKKMGMALVNHFWLEDSLNFWTLLPESSYNRSGWEAETLKAVENVVSDSGEDEDLVIKDDLSGKQSPCDKVTVISHAQILNEKNENLGVDDCLNKGSELHEKSNSRHGLSPPTSDGKVRNVGSAVDRITDGSDDIRRLEEMNIFAKPSASDFLVDNPAAATDNVHGGSVSDVEEDESTHLYVEDGNESDHSCGRTSDEEAKLKTDFMLVEMCEPADDIATTCHKMEMMDFATEHKVTSAAEIHNDTSGGENVESLGTERRRSSQFMSKAEEPPLESSSPCDEEAKDFADSVLQESPSFSSALNQQPAGVPGSTVKPAILSSPAGPGLLVQEPPQEMEECDPNSSFSVEASAMEISSNETEHVMRDVRDEQGPSAGNSGDVDLGGADANVPIPNQEAEKSVKRKNVKGKKPALKTNVSSNNALPETLAQVARSYNPSRKEKSKKKKLAIDEDKENRVAIEDEDDQIVQHAAAVRKNATTKKTKSESRKVSSSEPSKMMCFAVGGSTDERTKLHSIIKIMGGRISKSRYQWRDEATHVVLPGPLRRTEKFLAGAAAGRWILKPEYLEASRKAGKFLEEEAFEWYYEGTNDKGTISLLAPRKWRISVATSGVRAFHGLRVLFYGECISPPLDTMKRAIKAGGGEVLAAAPPFTRHLANGVNFAIISPGIPKEDEFVQEFLEHEVACVLSDYLVNLVCHPSSSLEQYILYGTEKAAKQYHTNIAQFGSSFQYKKAQPAGDSEVEDDPSTDDVSCSICEKPDHGEVMLLCDGEECGAGIHTFCCTPPLLKVPDGDWFCPKCK
ncbi:unnamed protein product [Calypogeia fissa]